MTPSEVNASVSRAAPMKALEKIAIGWTVTTATRKTKVSMTSSRLRASSFGVFLRLAPSTRAIIRSRKLAPGSCVMRTTIRSDSTFVPPVTGPIAARLTNHRGGLAADRRLVDAGHSLHDVTVARDEFAGRDQHQVAATQVDRRNRLLGKVRRREAWLPVADSASTGLLARTPKRVRLRLPTALGDRLGEVGEDHGQPQPRGDQPPEHARVHDGEARGQRRPDLGDEHDRVADHGDGVELAQRGRQGKPQLTRIQQARTDAVRALRSRRVVGLVGRGPHGRCGAHQNRSGTMRADSR